MAFITGKTPQGNCGVISYTQDGHYLCGPVPDRPEDDPRTVNLFQFYIRIEGEPGEVVPLDIHYPRYDPNIDKGNNYIEPDFFTLAPRCMYTSTDEINWQRIDESQMDIDMEDWTIRLSLTLTAPVHYLSVNYYYTRAMYAELRKAMAKAEYAREITIGRARDGQQLYLYKVTDPAVSVEQKKIVYMQGALHCCEYGGPHTLDAILRYLTGGTEAAGELLKKYEFHILPVASLGDWAAGFKDEWITDGNRCWVDLSTAESRVIDAYLHSLPKPPAFAVDIHNARKNFLFVKAFENEHNVTEQLRLAELIWEHCDFTKHGVVHMEQKLNPHTFREYAWRTYENCWSFTMEVDRFSLYDRQLGESVPLSREAFARFGSQLPHAVDLFLSTDPVKT